MARKGYGREYTKEMQTFGKRLKQLRKLRGLTQEALGLETRLGPQHISELESGKKDPNLSTIIRLAELLEITPASFFFNSREAERAAKLFNLSSFYEAETSK